MVQDESATPEGEPEDMHADKTQSLAKHIKQPSVSSSAPSSPTGSEPSDWASAPSTRPPSRAASVKKILAKLTPSTPPSKPPSVHSQDGHKFNLKDLLAQGPKLSRRSSQRSVSSRRSDTDRESIADGKARSTAGDSTTSLSKKYGICQKVAIGKGATSVVKLAHKWDRSEERLYAVKVCLANMLTSLTAPGIPEAA